MKYCVRRARCLCARAPAFEGEVFEREILKRCEKEKLELIVTRDESEADLVIEVYRKKFSTRFVFSVIEPGTKRVVTSDKASSLGGDIEPDLANLLIKNSRPRATNPVYSDGDKPPHTLYSYARNQLL